MESGPLEIILDLDKHLGDLAEAYPVRIYALLFVVIFAETGLVVTAALPGDSLLFAAGALAAGGGLEIRVVLPLLAAASFSGDQANFLIGRLVGDRPFRRDSRLFNQRHLDRAKRFYRDHGGMAVILGRFIPVVRSVVPLAASAAGMPYARFAPLSLAGSVLFAGLFVLLGYLIGNLPVVKENFALVIGIIVLITLSPGIVQFLRLRRRSPHGKQGGKQGRRAT